MLRQRLFVPVLALALAPAFGGCASGHDHADMTLEQMRHPTPEHKFLLQGVGTWEGTLTNFNMPGASAQPVATKEVVEAVGEFFTQSRTTCDFMGMPFVGVSCVGYDPASKQVVGTWCDNTSSFLTHMQGELDVAGKKMVMHFHAPDEMTGEMTEYRMETVFGPDTYTSTFYKGEGEGTMTMVMAMKRTGGGSADKK